MNEVNTLSQSLGRVEGKIDLLLTQFASHALDDDNNFALVNKRLAANDQKLNWLWGVGAAVVAFVSYLTEWHKF